MIFVTNPSKQHTPYLVQSLSREYNGKVFWLSSILFNPPFFMRKWSFFQQRKLYLVNENQMIIPAFWWLREIILRLFFKGELRNFMRDRLHDAWVCRLVKKYRPDILIGSEKSCKNAFLAVKKYNGMNILDLAQIHVDELEVLRDKHPFLKDEWGSPSLCKEIQKVKRLEYELADFILVISSKMKCSLLMAGISPQKIGSVRLGVDHKIFYPNASIKTDNQLFKLIFVGNLSEAKGVTFLLKLMERLVDFPISLTLIGSNVGVFQSSTRLPNIFFAGILDQASVANYLQKADVFVFPSYLDSWGMAVVEAMACGLPVIISDRTGASELVDNHTGFILPIIEDQWITSILYLYFHPKARKEMGLQASMQVASLTWENYQADLKANLNRMVKTLGRDAIT
jgi:glycosyltransferase involved in cell wall biosynthesis